MIAQVIIDLPTSALNRCFDYLIPEKFIPLAKKGVRVIVPFGNNNSQHLGYIVNIINKSDFANKYLISVLDEQPYFNEELFLLAEEMLKTPFVLKTLVYNTVIPKEFLITYLKEIVIIKRALIPENIQFLIPQQDKFLLNANNKILQELQKLSQKGILKIQNILKTTKKERTTICYSLNPKIKSLSQLNLTPKQKDFILKLFSLQQYLDYNQSDPLHKITILRKEALLLTSPSIINKLLQQEILLKGAQKIDIVLKHHFEPLGENKKIILNEEQIKLLQQINLKKHQTYLLHGKTGSGKTEIYLNLIAKILKQKQQVLFLVPEVMLIAPLMQRLKSKFTMTEIAVLHSYLTPLQRQEQFTKIKNQKVQIVLGTRSAIFAPLNYLGIIIVDEEHDDSLLEKEKSPYDAKELAQIRAKYHQIPLILGSATPSLESYHQVSQKKYQLLKLTQRALIKTFPPIQLIDMKEELKKGNLEPFSHSLKKALEQTLAKKEQAILFINTKGFSPFVLCRFCGHVPKCYNCNYSLTFYHKNNMLKCSYCGYKTLFTTECSCCQKNTIKAVGIGIEYIEHYLQKNFPQAKMIKFDSDNITKISQYERLWSDFQLRKSDILLGTQMIAKGLDFHQVTLVGVLMADALLKIPNFKASEKTFQLLIQAAGRCARKKEGKVIIQSYNLEHFAIKRAALYDENNFIKQLLEERKITQNFPFGYLSKILIAHSNFQKTFKIAFRIKKILEHNFQQKIKVLGPLLSLIPKKNNYYRCLLTLKYQKWPLNLNFITSRKIHQDAFIFFDRFAVLL